MMEIGQAPVVVKKEVNGFVLNRLQYALLMEAWRLVEVSLFQIHFYFDIGIYWLVHLPIHLFLYSFVCWLSRSLFSIF